MEGSQKRKEGRDRGKKRDFLPGNWEDVEATEERVGLGRHTGLGRDPGWKAEGALLQALEKWAFLAALQRTPSLAQDVKG